jgi:4-hydroxy-tetrahydrodipicolinate reductase
VRDHARSYADGALVAIRRVSTLVGVHRGLDAVLDLSERRVTSDE